MRYLSLLLLFLSYNLLAQIPNGYYDAADGQTGYNLKTSLYNIIKDHDAQSYSALWSLYHISDVKSNGKIWDMYSDVPGGTPSYEYIPGDDQCGNYSGEGSCYNREHSFPKSWFNDASPMYTDPFHIVPTDGYVNGQRGNYPFGEVGSATFTSTNGSKVGTCNYPGYSGTVFEPIDEYKGDFARGYFYMATRYENVISGWETNNSNGDAMLDGTSDHVFETWALNMLIEWHSNDPVSQKEIDRNDAIHDYQGNRNPFIDHPEYVACIWQNDCGGGSPSPIININESITDFGTIAFGNVSATQSYTISASDLTSDLTISASDSYQIAEVDNDADYSNSVVLSPSSGTVNSTTIYVRFKPSSELNSTVNGQITHSSTGASDIIIDVTGAEESDEPAPELTITESITDFGTVSFGTTSAIQSYIIDALNLTGDLVISSSNSFEISLTSNNEDFSTSINLTPSSGSITDEEIFVRFNPVSNTNALIQGTISHTSTGLSEETIDVSGIEEADPVSIPEINFNFTEITIRNTNLQTISLFSDVAPNTNLLVPIAISSLTNINVADFTTNPILADSKIVLEWEAGETSASLTFQVINEEILTNALVKNIVLLINDSEDNEFIVGTNNSTLINIEGSVVSGLNVTDLNQIITYPNPVENQLFIDGLTGDYIYSIIDLTGRTVLFGAMSDSEIIDVSSLISGTYIIRLMGNELKYSGLLLKR